MPLRFIVSLRFTRPCGTSLRQRSRRLRNRVNPISAGWLNRKYQAHKRTFSRATATSLAATVVDFATLYCLVEFAHVYYVIATACGACVGALLNFTLNKYWAFDAKEGSTQSQGFRYLLVSASSLVLNTGLVFFFTEFGQLRYLLSKAIAALAVGWGWNYPLHRYFVFPSIEGTDDDAATK